VVHFDRLNRTLHALNFLAQQRHAGGYLQLAVHPRHLQAVQSQHGLVYEAILKRCGLAPADIVLEINARQIGHQASLSQALNNYRQRGYRLALSDFSSTPDFDGLLALQPNILKLRPEGGKEGLDVASSAGIATELSGIESGQDFVLACTAGMDFGQGSLFGLPQADCLPTHSRRRVAYNSHSSSRVPP
jgi:EAL domain-containing protein (putative c-di-GMP-specific phosphodiesterase class I)